MRLALAAFVFLDFALLSSLGQDSKPTTPPIRVGTPGLIRIPARTYDPTRDATRDIAQAIGEARKSGKRILLDVGGDWCPWCRTLDRLFYEHPDLLRYRERSFITVPVYYGSENKNEKILSRYSKVLGIPHFFVLDNTGALLHSQHLTDLQTGGRYSPDKMKEFLTKWSCATANAPKAGSN